MNRTPISAREDERLIPLTKRQQAVLDAIRRHLRATKRPPSRKELALELGLQTPQAVDVHINALVRKKRLVVSAGKARGLQPIEPDEVPLIDISRTAQEHDLINAECTVDHVTGRLADNFDPRPDCFVALDNDTLQACGARAGDWLAVRVAAHATEGDLVIARIDGALTCKRLSRSDESLQIAGVVIGALTARTFTS